MSLPVTAATACLFDACLKLVTVVEAKLPFNSTIATPVLKKQEGVTFDPLGVAAILHNQRADSSAVRLYTQRNGNAFRWPHTMMLGGVLTPLKVFVEHLASSYSTVHPASMMCQRDGTKLAVRSDTVFRELPLNFSNAWMEDALAFKPSAFANNDIMVCHVVDLFQDKSDEDKPKESVFYPESLLLDAIALLTGLMLAVCTVFSVLTGDMWAVVLFFFFLLHWIASTLISFRSMVKKVLPPNKIKVDPKTRYALHDRPGNQGTVVFKGRQDAIEEWARVVWEFQVNFINKVLHWAWIITGSLAAFASVACMVNMNGDLQLAFLGILSYSSAAEIFATRIARNLQKKSQHQGRTYLVTNNNTRTLAIARATLSGPLECRLEGCDWVGMGLLPPMEEFTGMQTLLKELGALRVGQEAEVNQAVNNYLSNANFAAPTPENPEPLAYRIAREARETWKGANRPDSETSGGKQNA